MNRRLLTDEEIQKLKTSGYTAEQIDTIQRQEDIEQGCYPEQMPMGNSQFDNQGNDTIAMLQLECTKVLRDIERLLRCDDSVYVNGDYVFIPTKDDEKKVFNDYGVKVMMRFIRMYVNPLTILAFFGNPEDIKSKVYNFGIELTDLIYMKHIEFGMDTDSKCKEYPMIVNSVKDLVHNCYTRSYQGIGNETLGKVAAFDRPSPETQGYSMPIAPQQSNGPSLNPLNWFRR